MNFSFSGIGISTVVAITLATIVAYLAIAFYFRSRIQTPNDFFIAGGNLDERHLKATYLGTNVTFTSILIALAAYGFTNGVITFWILVWWLAGMVFFWWIYPRIADYFKTGQTLHEFLGMRYHSRGLRVLASLVTVVVFTGTVGLELFGGVFLFQKLGILPILDPVTLAFIIALALVIYTVMGGFKVAVRTDMYQIVFIVVALIIVAGGAILFSMRQNISLTQFIGSEGMSPNTFVSDPVWIIAMLFMFFPFQLCVMDMWQRCAAVEGKVDYVRRMIKFDIIGFIPAFSIPILIGILVKTAGFNLSDTNDAFFAPLIHTMGPLWVGIMYAGLFAAILSTADTLLICSAHSFVRDVLGTIKGINFDQLSPERQESAVLSARLWTIVVGVAAVGVMFLFNWFSLYDLIIAVFSAQIVFFIPLIVAIIWPQFASTRSASAIASISFGFMVPILVVGVGKLIGDSLLVNAAPIAGFVASLLVFSALMWWKREPSYEKQQE